MASGSTVGEKLNMAEQTVVAFAWYRSGDYDRIRAFADDGGGMDPTFGQWQEQAKRKLAEIRARGMIVRKIVVDPDEFAAWLRERNVKADNQSRAQFVAEIARRDER